MNRGGKSRTDARGRNPDRAGSGDRTLIIRRSFWHSPHVAALSGAGRALVVELHSMFNGTNNGELFLSVRDAAARLGFRDLAAANGAILELERLGLVTVTAESSFAMKAGETSRARAFRLNWIGKDGKCVGADSLPPLDFSRLSPREKRRIAQRSGALERYLKEQQKRKLAVRETRTLMADSVRETRTEAAGSVRESLTLDAKTGGNPPSHIVRESTTHILHHIPSDAAVELIRSQLSDWWRKARAKERVALAKHCKLRVNELLAFIAGGELPFPKLAAIASSFRADRDAA